MSRVKRSVSAKKKRRKIFKRVKGFGSTRRASLKKAKESILKAETNAYKDRRTKKRTMRGLWQTRINAACRQHGLSYSKFIHLLKEKNILLDRKILSLLASDFPKAFSAVVKVAKKAK